MYVRVTRNHFNLIIKTQDIIQSNFAHKTIKTKQIAMQIVKKKVEIEWNQNKMIDRFRKTPRRHNH